MSALLEDTMATTAAPIRFAQPIDHVFTATGRIDTIELAKILGKKKAAIARTLGVRAGTLRSKPDSELAQAKAWKFVNALNELASYLPDWRSCMIWMRTPHISAGEPPMAFIDSGDIETFATLVRMIGTGQPG